MDENLTSHADFRIPDDGLILLGSNPAEIRDRILKFHEDSSTMAVSACVTVRHRQNLVTQQCPMDINNNAAFGEVLDAGDFRAQRGLGVPGVAQAAFLPRRRIIMPAASMPRVQSEVEGSGTVLIEMVSPFDKTNAFGVSTMPIEED